MSNVEAIPAWWGSGPLPMMLVGLTGILAWHLIPERLSTTRLLVQIVFFGAMSALLLAGSIVPYEPTAGTSTAELLTGAAKTLWWLHLAWALIGFVRLYLVIERKPREARLLQDILVGIVYVGMILSVLAFVVGAPVGTLLATSGVLAIVIGLALQNTLGDLFSGIALNIGRPFAIGDWIRLGDGTEGRVVETNWQSTHLLTSTHNVMALPNSLMAKSALTNFSRPDETHVVVLSVRLVPTATPDTLADIVRTALLSADLVLKDFPPSVSITGIDASAIELELKFGVSSIDERAAARDSVIDLVYRHAWAEGLSLAAPVPGSIAPLQAPLRVAEVNRQSHSGLPFEMMPAFRLLGEDNRTRLKANVSSRHYLKDEIIVTRGEILASLLVVGRGVIGRLPDCGHKVTALRHFGPGDVFGRSGKDGERETLQARSYVIIHEIGQKAVDLVEEARPEWASELAHILHARGSGPAGETDAQMGDSSSHHGFLRAAQDIFRHRAVRQN